MIKKNVKFRESTQIKKGRKYANRQYYLTFNKLEVASLKLTPEEPLYLLTNAEILQIYQIIENNARSCIALTPDDMQLFARLNTAITAI